MIRSSRRGLRRGFLRARDGSTAVEFTFVAFPLFFMIFAVLEVGLYFTIDTVLDNAAVETGRLIRTGQARDQAMTASEFKSRLCSRMSLFAPGCNERLTVDVQVINQNDPPPPDPLADGSFDKDERDGLEEGYTNGNPGDLILVRAWYEQPLATAFLSQGLSRLKDGTVMLSVASVFRNEPK